MSGGRSRMSVLRSAGVIVVVLTIVLFAEDIWQLRNHLKGGLIAGLGLKLSEEEFVVQAPTATTTSADVLHAVVPSSSEDSSTPDADGTSDKADDQEESVEIDPSSPSAGDEMEEIEAEDESTEEEAPSKDDEVIDMETFVYLPASPRECPGCEGKGTCNVDLGRCDCPLGMGGPTCEQPLAPACTAFAARVSPELHLLAACPVAAPATDGYSGSCACLRECWDAGVELPPEWWCYDDSTVNSFTAPITLQQLQAAPQRRVDLRQPANVVSEETAAAKWTPQSTCPQACNGQGTCVEGKCVCHFNSGFRGPACADSYEPFCINQCSEQGLCVRGVCQCVKGFYGIDCSIPVDRSRLPKVDDVPYPRIFVYELPPQYNTWHLAACGEGTHRSTEASDDGQKFAELHGRYKTATFLTERMLTSKHRVYDPMAADYFFVPLFDACDHAQGRAHYYREAMRYIGDTFPYWKVAPDRHLLVAASDTGACEVAHLDELADAKWLVHWGLYGRPRGRVCTDGGLPACYVPGKDVVLPPWIPHEGAHSADHTALSDFLLAQGGDAEAARRDKSRLRHLYVDRQMELPEMSSVDGCNATQGVVQALNAQEVIRADDGFTNHLEGFTTSTFCLSTAATGWSQWTTLAVLYGCIPVILQDNITMPFEEELPYEHFALRLAVQDAPNLVELLGEVTDDELTKLQEGLACVWRRFLWSSVHGPYAGESAAEDAFATLMDVLDLHLKREEDEDDKYAYGTLLSSCGKDAESEKVLGQEGVVVRGS